VAHALMRAASALMPTPDCPIPSGKQRKSFEMFVASKTK
jgi:hypothetical protein